jgi:hypothetical protein
MLSGAHNLTAAMGRSWSRQAWVVSGHFISHREPQSDCIWWRKPRRFHRAVCRPLWLYLKYLQSYALGTCLSSEHQELRRQSRPASASGGRLARVLRAHLQPGSYERELRCWGRSTPIQMRSSLPLPTRRGPLAS